MAQSHRSAKLSKVSDGSYMNGSVFFYIKKLSPAREVMFIFVPRDIKCHYPPALIVNLPDFFPCMKKLKIKNER